MSAGGGGQKRGGWVLIGVQFVSLLAFWVVLSGQFNALFIGMGVLSAAVVTAFTHDLVGQSLGPHAGGVRTLVVRGWRSLGFALWVLTRIPPAGVQIAFYVLHPRMPVEPGVMRFRTHLESQVARTLLANTITLIPGTLTVAVEDREFVVHVFVPPSAGDLVDAHLQNRIARVFLQEPEEPPEVTWEPAGEATREALR